MGIGNVYSTTRVLTETLDLKDRPEVLDEIKFVIRMAASENFDLDHVFSKQDPAKLAEVKSRICQRFPDIFEDPSLDRAVLQERMKYAVYYTEKCFNSMRHTFRSQKRRRSDTPLGRGGLRVFWKPKERSRFSSPYVPKTPVLRGSFGTQPRRVSPRLSAMPRRNMFPGSVVGTSTDAVHNSQSPLPPYSSLSFTSEMPSATQSGNAGSPPDSSSAAADVTSPTYTSTSKTETSSSSSATTRSATTSSSPTNSPFEYRIGEVAAFLRSCEPSMQFLLNSFISFGCRNRQFLAAVAKWDDNEIEDFLKRVVTHTPPAEVSCLEMEFWILRRHFKTFFGKRAPTNGGAL